MRYNLMLTIKTSRLPFCFCVLYMQLDISSVGSEMKALVKFYKVKFMTNLCIDRWKRQMRKKRQITLTMSA